MAVRINSEAASPQLRVGSMPSAPDRLQTWDEKKWFQISLNCDVTKGSGTLISVPLQTGPTRLQFYQEAVNTQLTATDSSMIGCSPGYGDQSGGTFKLT